jgi:UDP-2,3-diacylglucosamine pyrophosphatase LpxH
VGGDAPHGEREGEAAAVAREEAEIADVALERDPEGRRGVGAEDVGERAGEELEDDALGAKRLHGEREDLAEALGHGELAVAHRREMREERGAADGGVAEADGDEDAVLGRLAQGRQEGRDHRVVVREAGGVAAAAAEQVRERRARREELEVARARAVGVGDDGHGEPPQRLDLERHQRLVARDGQAREAELLAQAAHAGLGGAEEGRGLQRREEITEADREGVGERSGCHGGAEGSPVPGELDKLSERGPRGKWATRDAAALAGAPHRRRRGQPRMDQLDQLHAVSDLHLGGAPGHQIFDRGPLLAGAIDALRERAPGARVGLVLNGDIVDFLAAPGATYLDPFGAVAKLEAILTDPAFRPVWDALARFVRAPGRTLVLGLGNHDVELSLPDVQARLLQAICGDSLEAHARVRIAMDGTGYACEVGGRRVLCVHGNEVDAWNVVDQSALNQVIRSLRHGSPVDAWDPNAGTRLVIDVMNGIKRSFPMVDLLKPETRPVVAVLLALDPSSLSALKRFAPIAARLGVQHVRSARFLGEDNEAAAAAAAPLDEGAALAALLQRKKGGEVAARAGSSEAARLLDEVEELYREGKDPLELSPAGATLGFGDLLLDALLKRDPVKDLRESLQGWLAGDKTFALDTEDEVSRGLDERVGPGIDFVVAGHTHLARALRRKRGGGYYFNSGTWVRLIRLSEAMLADDLAFAPVFQAFRGQTLEALDGVKDLVFRNPTMVSIEVEGDAVVGVIRRAVEVEVEGKGSVDLVADPASRLALSKGLG